MNTPTRTQILQLYKQLIRYGSEVRLTDKSYFLGRVRQEFKENRSLTDEQEIEFNFKVNVVITIVLFKIN